MRLNLVLMMVLGLAPLGCGGDDEEPIATKSAKATLTSTTGNNATGTATFTQTGSQVTLSATISGAPASATLGFHVHANAECGADGMAAGGHWNPTMTDHGMWGGAAHHAGDIGNVVTDASGNASVQLTTDKWSIGSGSTNDVVNHAVVLHAMPDDFTTQPTGNAGARIACGVVALQ